jgi:uncharacterized membrane protein
MIGAGVLTMAFWGIAAAAADVEQASADSATAATAPPDSAAAAPATAVHQYVGVKKCKMCHSSEKGGAQYGKWLASKHAKAYGTLAGDIAKGIAKKRGIADPQKSADCLQCHVTGYGEPADHFAATYVAADGVQCESCHGAGKDYIASKTMKGITAGTLKGADYGLVLPTKDRCVQCHNVKSPTFVEMNFASDSTKIAHPIPPGYKSGAAEGDKAGTN